MPSVQFHALTHARNSVLISLIGILVNGFLLWFTAWAYGYSKSDSSQSWQIMFDQNFMPFLLPLFLVSVLVALGVFLLSLALSFHRSRTWSTINRIGVLISMCLSFISIIAVYGLPGLGLLFGTLLFNGNNAALLNIYVPLAKPTFWCPLLGLIISCVCSGLLVKRLKVPPSK
jgi:hypothetical protein